MIHSSFTSILPATFSDIRDYWQKIDSLARNSMNIFKRLQFKDSKYSGAYDEIISECIIESDVANRGFSLPKSEKRKFLHNLFRDKALCYYHTFTQVHRSTFSQAIKKRRSQYDYVAKQQSLKDELYAV